MVTLRNMGEVEAKWERVTRHDLRHDRHTFSLLTDHKTFKKKFYQKRFADSPKYRGKVLEGEVAEATEEIVIDEEKGKLRAHKTWYISLYNKLFGGKHQK